MSIAPATAGFLAALVAAIVPATAASQQALQISRARTVVALTVSGQSLPTAASLVNATRRACALAPNIEAEATDQIASALLASVPPQVPPGLVVVTATTQANNTSCGASPEAAAMLAAAAIEFQRPAPHAAISRLEVVVGDRVVAPALARTVRTLPLWARASTARTNTPRGTSIPSSALQVVVPLDALFPAGRNGSLPVLVRVAREGEASVEEVVLTEQDIDALWRLALPVRAAAAGADSGLARGVAYAAPLDVKELPTAAAMLWQLSAAGDSLASRSLAREALRVEPCLRLPGGAPPVAVADLNRFRRDVHCRARHPAVALLRGALIPGLGQQSTTRRTLAGLVVLGVVAQRLQASQQSKRDGRAFYQQYVNATSTADANTYWALADEARRRTDRQLLQASAVWVGAMAEATWFEWRLGRRLRFAAPIALPMH